jgi:RNA polymerase sigma-70 factor (ECF subfamily)
MHLEPWPDFERHYVTLYRHAYRLVGNADAAQDVAQEACLRCVREGPTAEGGDAVRRWLFVVARNLCFSLLRDRSRHPHESLDEARPPASRGPNPAEAALADERRMLVRQAIGRLPEDLREAIVFREYEDLSYQEIADMTGSPIGTVKSRIARAREALRMELAPLLQEEDRP